MTGYKDKTGTAAVAAVTIAGAGAAAAAAPAIATAAGVTAIPFVTWAASAIGLTVVTATPVGWIVGAAALGALAAGGGGCVLRRQFRSAARREQIMHDLAARARAKCAAGPV